MRFSEIAQSIPQLSDRLLSERMKELEARGLVERRVLADTPARVEYELTEAGKELAPPLEELKALVAPLAGLTTPDLGHRANATPRRGCH